MIQFFLEGFLKHNNEDIFFQPQVLSAAVKP